MMRNLAIGFAVLIVLVLATVGPSIRARRTEELAAPRLPIVDGGPAVEIPRRIWIDTDAACGDRRRSEPDDCFAILLLAKAAGPRLVGVSTVFGNAPLEVTDGLTRELAATIARDGAARVAVHRGSAEAAGEVSALQPAHLALRQALEEGPLMVVSLGPLTNVAKALDGRPDLRTRVGRLVAVMGRRPGHRFQPAEGRRHTILFGDGPVFSDANFVQDREAAAAVLAMHLPTTLIPYEAGLDVSVTAGDLARLAASGGAARWVAERARGWLDFWRTEVGIAGFYPFDALAAAYAVEPGYFDCAQTSAWVARDERLWGWFGHPWGFLVGLDGERPTEIEASGEVVYCPKTDADLEDWMIERLLRAG
jgi:inosine-uridine nucleoside N-ribohydrolase